MPRNSLAMKSEELEYIKTHWQLGSVAMQERLHLMTFEVWNGISLCGVSCNGLTSWMDDPKLLASQVKRLCPNCKKFARRKRDNDSGTSTKPPR